MQVKFLAQFSQIINTQHFSFCTAMTLVIILVDAAFCDLGPEKSHFPNEKYLF